MGTMSAFSARISTNTPARYAVAVLAILLALLVHWLPNPFLGESLQYSLLFPAIVFSAWFCGVGPSLLAIAISLAGVRYLFIAPAHSLSLPGIPQLAGLIAFTASALAVVTIGEVIRRNNAALYQAQGELEERVQQRTIELNEANRSLGELSARLLHLQDEERRRIARELHDSVGQTLAALAMNLSSVGADIERFLKTARVVADSTALVNDMSTDIRTISYLLHPPLLDEAGLSSALSWYIKGFSERSKIDVSLEMPEDFGRLPSEMETAIFRVVQECLTNIHRHSESQVAKIRITHANNDVRIEVQDKGKGIPPEKYSSIISAPSGTPGVGIRGMRERLRQLGGSLELHSDGRGKGTVVVARLPIVCSPMDPLPAAKSAAAGASVTPSPSV
jgi:signal transduction histidine kinase